MKKISFTTSPPQSIICYSYIKFIQNSVTRSLKSQSSGIDWLACHELITEVVDYTEQNNNMNASPSVRRTLTVTYI